MSRSSSASASGMEQAARPSSSIRTTASASSSSPAARPIEVHPCRAASSQKRRSSAGSSANATALSGGQCRASDLRAASRSSAMSSVSLRTTALPLSIFDAPTSCKPRRPRPSFRQGSLGFSLPRLRGRWRGNPRRRGSKVAALRASDPLRPRKTRPPPPKTGEGSSICDSPFLFALTPDRLQRRLRLPGNSVLTEARRRPGADTRLDQRSRVPSVQLDDTSEPVMSLPKRSHIWPFHRTSWT